MFIFSDKSEVNCVYVGENVFTMLCSCVAIARNLKEEAAAKRMPSLEYPIDYIEIFTPKSFFSFQQFHASHYHEREIL